MSIIRPRIPHASEFLTDRPSADAFGFDLGEVACVDVDPADDAFSLRDYKRIAVYDNPHASRAAETPKVVDNLKSVASQHGITVHQAQTSPDPIDNIGSLQQNLGQDDILAVIAGDGGVSAMLEAVRRGGHTNPVLVIGRGRKNDIARQLFLPKHIAHPERALGVATMQELRPILATLRADGREQTMDAYGYVSRGVSSAIARDVTTKEYREAREDDVWGERFLVERWIAIRNYLRAQPFNIKREWRSTRPRIDMIASNGNHMAGTFHPRAELLTPGFRIIELRNRLLGLAAVFGMATAMPVGRTIEAGESFAFDMSHTPDALLEIDGEVRRLLGNTTLELTVARSGVNVLTTRHVPKKHRPKHRQGSRSQ